MAKLSLNAPKVRHDAVVATRLQRIPVRIRSLVCGAQPSSVERSAASVRYSAQTFDVIKPNPSGGRLASMDRESDG